MLKLYNTLSKTIEAVEKKDHLNLYSCGPTVYSFAHIGNLRSYIFADLLYRALKEDGYNPKWVMNITDIDDKTIKGAILEYGPTATVQELKQYTDKYFKAFLEDLREVNVSVDEIQFIKVTDVITEVQEFIVELINKGYAYKAEDGSTYFSIEHYQEDFGDYGELVGTKFLEGKKVGARVKVDEYEKDNLSDFALWKAHTDQDAQIFWEHPILGNGRPGWHIECSVINKVAFGGEPTDIHTGGVDLVFPHHTNEIAQSQSLHTPFVNHWSHCEHLLVDGKKMSKSLGNIYTLADLKARGFTGADFRYFLLSSGYRNQQNFTWEALLSSHEGLESVVGKVQNVRTQTATSLPDTVRSFMDIVNNDLSFAKAVGHLFSLFGDNTTAGTEPELLELDKVLGLGLSAQFSAEEIPAQLSELLAARSKAKAGKDFGKSDELRKQIETLGYEVLDTPEGQKVKKKIAI